MANRKVTRTWKVADVLTDLDALPTMSDPTGTYGVKKTVAGTVVVADGTAMTKSATGTYEYTFAEPEEGIAYTAFIEFVYNGLTHYFEHELPIVTIESPGMTLGYVELMNRISRKQYGRHDYTQLTSNQQTDVEYAIKDGLYATYSAHRWSFLRPIYPITTTAPYTTGTVTVVDGVVTLVDGTFASASTWAAGAIFTSDGGSYEVDSYDDTTQITLLDTSVDIDAGTTYSLGRFTYDLPDAYDALEGDLTYPAEGSNYYPAIKMIDEVDLRRRRQDYEYSDRPQLAAIITAAFDDTVGSRRQIMFYPSPDAAYTLSGVMRLRPTMIDADNPYPIGGEVLAPVILEACFAAIERVVGDRVGNHEQKFRELLAEAIVTDKLASTPEWLGKDEGGKETRDTVTQLVGPITLDGVVL